MKILIIEDEKEKKENIENCIHESLTNGDFYIHNANNLFDARLKIIQEKFDLIIFDFYLPIKNNECELCDVSTDLIDNFKESDNYKTESIAITQYELNQIENKDLFNEHGVTIVQYNESDNWKISLRTKLQKLPNKVSCDFIIFCALTEERMGLDSSIAEIGEMSIINGMDCQKLIINGYNGYCITAPRMGLVSMSILSTKAIETFNPRIVSMSGICAGLQNRCNLMDLVVANICWEYQSGKHTALEFKVSPYQSTIDHHLEMSLKQYISSSNIKYEIKKDICLTELNMSNIVVGPIASGSAVISDESRMKEIERQHGKMLAIEMEMYALYEAASKAMTKPLFFGAKCVVDLGDENKNDDFHSIGCSISARFVTSFIANYLEVLDKK